jgi:hypothetical protein
MLSAVITIPHFFDQSILLKKFIISDLHGGYWARPSVYLMALGHAGVTYFVLEIARGWMAESGDQSHPFHP